MQHKWKCLICLFAVSFSVTLFSVLCQMREYTQYVLHSHTHTLTLAHIYRFWRIKKWHTIRRKQSPTVERYFSLWFFKCRAKWNGRSFLLLSVLPQELNNVVDFKNTIQVVLCYTISRWMRRLCIWSDTTTFGEKSHHCTITNHIRLTKWRMKKKHWNYQQFVVRIS